MISARFDSKKFLKSIGYSFGVSLIVSLIIYLIWLIFNVDRYSKFPIATLTLGIGGLLLTISGCIGPGKYKLEFDMVIFAPQSGTSFSEEIPVSGFSLNEKITSAIIVINSKEVGKINFIDGVGHTLIPRDVILEETINNIWLENKDRISNKNYFTLFDYSDDLTDEEIDDFSALEERAKNLDLTKAKEKYTKDRISNIGSVAWGIFVSSLLFFGIGIILDFIILN